MQLLDEYKDLIAKVCYVYSSPTVSMDDLYQEVAANIWTGLDNFRGEAKISTWIYRTAINTCITWLRRNRHQNLNTPWKTPWLWPTTTATAAWSATNSCTGS